MGCAGSGKSYKVIACHAMQNVVSACVPNNVEVAETRKNFLKDDAIE
jgi:hypothetical protein